MAEAIAVLGLISSIASLLEISAKVVSRVHDFTLKTTDVPEVFQSLVLQLPLLTTAVSRIQAQATAGSLPQDAAAALKVTVDGLLAQLSIVRSSLESVSPPQDASKLQRTLSALKSLSKEHRVCEAMEKIHKSIDILILHQTTQHVDTGERILHEISELRLSHPQTNSSASFGLCLNLAPQIEPDAFKGRSSELQQLRDLLIPRRHAQAQQIVSIVGMGGMGKTQLSITHARQCVNEYSSVFWVNARDETSLRHDMATLAALVHPDSSGPSARTVDDEKSAVNQFQQWLCQPGNDQWLLICDNYDDPRLPGVSSPTGYDIRPFFPINTQGTILITTRSTKLGFSKSFHLSKLEDMTTCIAILSQRSRRDLSQDVAVQDLARRLGGLPLALSTAGTYLASTGISCYEYLDLYRSMWTELVGQDSEKLYEYEARTLSSTWQVSVNQVQSCNEDAVRLLGFLAFLSPNDVWYELLRPGANSELVWLNRVTTSKIHFHRAMSQLQSYSLVNMVAGSYQVHPCLHDWLIEVYNTPPDAQLFCTALGCIANSISDETDPQYWTVDKRLLEHIGLFESPRLHHLWQSQSSKEIVFEAADRIGSLALRFDQHAQAECMFQRSLTGKMGVLGPDHMSTLTTIHNLGKLYVKQDKRIEAEQMFTQALCGRETVLGAEHITTLQTVHALGMLYVQQENLGKAEQLLIRALTGREKALGVEHAETLATLSTLGVLYHAQYKLDDAEQMYTRALTGRETAFGPDHPTTIDTVFAIGSLYVTQDKLDEAEQMYTRALVVREKALGTEHTRTLDTVYAMGNLYMHREKLDQAEQMYTRVLIGRERAYGPDHTMTLETVHALGAIHARQRNYDAAEKMYIRAMIGFKKTLKPDHSSISLVTQALANVYDSGHHNFVEAERMHMQSLAGYEKTLGPDHMATLNAVNHLGRFYYNHGELEKAMTLLRRVLAGREKMRGPEHKSTLQTVHNLGRIYHRQKKLDCAEEMYRRSLVGNEKVLGSEHKSTAYVAENLGRLYHSQGKLDEAEEMYNWALSGFEKTLGPEHSSSLLTVEHIGRLYRHQNKLDQAEKMYLRVLAGYEKTEGPDSESTIRAKGALDGVISDKNKLEAAKAACEQSSNLPASHVSESPSAPSTSIDPVPADTQQKPQAEFDGVH